MEVAPYHTLTLPAGDPRTFPSVFGIIESAAREGNRIDFAEKVSIGGGTWRGNRFRRRRAYGAAPRRCKQPYQELAWLSRLLPRFLKKGNIVRDALQSSLAA